MVERLGGEQARLPAVERDPVEAPVERPPSRLAAAGGEEGLAAFLPRYAALDALAERRVRLFRPDGDCDATALGLDADGALRLRLDDGRACVVHSGEVSVRAGA